MQNLLDLIRANWLYVAIGLLYLGLHWALTRRSQIDAWCNKHPRVAGVMKIVRGLGIDPWLIAQGLTLLFKGRLPVGYSTLADKILKVLAASSVALMLVGCSMSLEQSRAQSIVRRAQARQPATAATRSECESLDKTQRLFGYAAYGTGPIAPLAGSIAAVPGVDGKSQDALLVTAGVAAALTVFEFAEQQNFSRQWVEQGCGQ